MIRTLDARRGIDDVVAMLARAPAAVAPEIHRAVDEILAAVRARGDAALCEYTTRFDGWSPASAGDLTLTAADFEAAERAIPADVRTALEYAADRIERYHAAAMPKSWRMTDEHGSVLGQEIRPLDRVGVYVPGGRAAYPSTVLMTVVPARVAGVREIVLVTPAAGGRVEPVVLAAARLAGVTEGYRIGGAQAIAALAYGTARIARVDKIVGPGNIYVALAKARVFGEVGIDMVAGPSEVVVVADATADPDWVASDMLAQAEHDPMARALLVTDAGELIPKVAAPAPGPKRSSRTLPKEAEPEAAQAVANLGKQGYFAPGERRADPGGEPRRCGGARQPARPRAPGAAGRRPGRGAAARAPRRRRLPRPPHPRGRGRLRGRPEPCAADCRDRAVRVAARDGGLREAVERHRVLAGRAARRRAAPQDPDARRGPGRTR